MHRSTDVTSLQRLLGTVKYMAQYIPNELTITQPQRELLKKDAKWTWHPKHDKTLDNLTAVLTSKPALAFYDVTQPFTIQADASKSGLGACILKKGKPVAYASRAMTLAELIYAHIETEMLAIGFATSKFHHYVYGKCAVSVQPDHKPLECILKKPQIKAPQRLQRMMLRLHPYDLDVHYVPGKYMYLADTLSRDCVPGEGNAEIEEELSRIVHSIVLNVPVSASKLSEIRQARARTIGYWPGMSKDIENEVFKCSVCMKQ